MCVASLDDETKLCAQICTVLSSQSFTISKNFAAVTASDLFIFTVCVIACCSQSNFVRHRTPAAFHAKVTVLYMEMKVRMYVQHVTFARTLVPSAQPVAFPIDIY